MTKRTSKNKLDAYKRIAAKYIQREKKLLKGLNGFMHVTTMLKVADANTIWDAHRSIRDREIHKNNRLCVEATEHLMKKEMVESGC